MIRLRQVWRLSDNRRADPGKFFERSQELGGHLRNIDWRAGRRGEPIEIANIFLVRVSGYDSNDFIFAASEVPFEGSSHLRRAGIDRDSGVQHRCEKLTKKQGNGIG